MYILGDYFMGKRSPKPSFVDVPCPNSGCEDYGRIKNENVIGNETYSTKNCVVHEYFCKTCPLALHRMLTQFFMI